MGKEKSKKRKRSSSGDSCPDTEKKKIRKLKKKLKKEQKKADKAMRKKLKERQRLDKKRRKESDTDRGEVSEKKDEETSADIPLELMEKSKAMAPMTKEEWEKRQSVVRWVYDEETGRRRLIKGDGEVLEEIVSRERHKQINKAATRADGEFFQSKTATKLY